jgi:hypothetical protein
MVAEIRAGRKWSSHFESPSSYRIAVLGARQLTREERDSGCATRFSLPLQRLIFSRLSFLAIKLQWIDSLYMEYSSAILRDADLISSSSG